MRGTLPFLYLSHLLNGICVKIFIMNRYISKNYANEDSPLSVGSLGFFSCFLLPFLPTRISWLSCLTWRVVPHAWRFFVWRVGPHGCLPLGPPFSKHLQSSLEFLFHGRWPVGGCQGNPQFICISPKFICLLLALLIIGTYPPFSLFLIAKLIGNYLKVTWPCDIIFMKIKVIWFCL